MLKKSFLHSTLIFLIVFTSIALGNNRNGDRGKNLKVIESVKLATDSLRFYIHYDAYGNLPDSDYLERLSSNIRKGDDIEVRYYPTHLFTLDDPHIDLPTKERLDSTGAVILYPQDLNDTVSINNGSGDVYFVLPSGGSKYRLRVAKNRSSAKIGNLFDLNHDTCSVLRQELSEVISKRVKSSGIIPENLPEAWQVRFFERVEFKPGICFIEIFKISGKKAKLIAASNPYMVMERFDSVKLLYGAELSSVSKIEMTFSPVYNCYAARVPSEIVKTGVQNVNIAMDYVKNSWQQRQAPNSALGARLKYDWDIFTISVEKVLPNSFRIRPGFAVFNEGRNVRLISNFVFIRKPESYFSSNTPFLNILNPCIGLQIGGTGAQDIVLLLGLSLKCINEADLVVGFRFGLKPDEPWKGSSNYYFGSTIDLGLFNVFRGTQK